MIEPLLEEASFEGVFRIVIYVTIALIGFDIITGLLASAKEKEIQSSVSWNGIINKTGELVAVVFLILVDFFLDMDGEITSMGVGMVVIHELISIIENFSRIGINVNFINKYLKDKIETPEGDEKEDDE